MNPEIKAKWIARLESGKEKQGTGALKKVFPTSTGKIRKVRHCCLGVLCELAKEEGIVVEHTPELLEIDSMDMQEGIEVTFNDADAFLPNEVADWAGVPRHDSFNDVQSQIADINDSYTTFKKSIKFIKENL